MEYLSQLSEWFIKTEPPLFDSSLSFHEAKRNKRKKELISWPPLDDFLFSLIWWMSSSLLSPLHCPRWSGLWSVSLYINSSTLVPPVLPVPAIYIDNRYTGMLWQQWHPDIAHSLTWSTAGRRIGHSTTQKCYAIFKRKQKTKLELNREQDYYSQMILNDLYWEMFTIIAQIVGIFLWF